MKCGAGNTAERLCCGDGFNLLEVSLSYRQMLPGTAKARGGVCVLSEGERARGGGEGDDGAGVPS
jgi:hypothetical protein